jgi:4-amino-4-deoxy-L-arabinose transferase-like glycosyltransferase
MSFSTSRIRFRSCFADVAAGLVVALGTLVRVASLSDAPFVRQSFRQSQTALVVRGFARDGFDWRTPLPVFGPDSLVPFEFPAFQWIAAQLVRVSGISPALGARVVGLLFFQLSTVLLYLIMWKSVDRRSALLAVILAQTLPFGLAWSTAALIEFMPVAAMLLATYLLLDGGDRFRWRVIGAAIAVIVAALVKITTAMALMPLLLMGALLSSSSIGALIRSRAAVHAVLTGVGGLVAGVIWTRLADGVKSSQEGIGSLASQSLHAWNFGTVRQRADLNAWSNLEQYSASFAPLTVILGVLVLILLRDQVPLPVWLLGATSVLGPLIFFNLYVVHDYYFAAVYFAAVAFLGALLSLLIDSAPQPSRPMLGSALISAMLLSTSLGSTYGFDYVNRLRTRPAVPPLVEDIQRWVAPGSVVVLLGCDWDPTLAFLTDRTAYMVRPPITAFPPAPDVDVAAVAWCTPDSMVSEQDLAAAFPGSDVVRVSESLFTVQQR